MSDWSGFGQGIASQAIGSLMDMGVSAVNRGGNYRRNVKLMNRQHGQNAENMQRAYDLNMQKWLDTNYPAQVEQMKKAGLNVGLMYEGGGAGGQSGNMSATSSGLPSSSGQGAGLNTMDLMNRTKQTEAQVELMEAQADKEKAEAERLRGYGKEESEARTADLKQGVDNKIAQQKLTEIQSEIGEIDKYVKENTASLNVHRVISEVNYLENQVEHMARRNWIDEQTKNEKVRLVKQEVITNILTQNLIEAKTGLTNEQTRKTVNDIKMEIQENMRKWDGMSLQSVRQDIELMINQKDIDLKDRKGTIDAILGIIK